MVTWVPQVPFEFMFDQVWFFFKIKSEGQDAEELELELIDFGAEEIGLDEDALVITGTFESFGQLQSKLEGDGMEILESGLETHSQYHQRVRC